MRQAAKQTADRRQQVERRQTDRRMQGVPGRDAAGKRRGRGETQKERDEAIERQVMRDSVTRERQY